MMKFPRLRPHTLVRVCGPARPFSSGTRLMQRELRDAYIISASRTPTGKYNGQFMDVPATQLGAVAIESALGKARVPDSLVSDVYMGSVLQAGLGQAPARQAAIRAGLPNEVEAVTVNKVCSSGLKAVALAAQNIQLGLAEAQVAGGMENMSQVPYYVPRPSSFPAFGPVRMEDGLITDGLTDAYQDFHMGVCAEKAARAHAITREMQDDYAIRSYKRAQAAWAEAAFNDEIAAVSMTEKAKTREIAHDEGYQNRDWDKVRSLKPAFVRDGTGTITAANASTLNDGASALVLASKAVAKEYGHGSRVLARICASADAAVDPVDFPIAPSRAIPLALSRAGISKEDVSIWEINEAFAAVVEANIKILGLSDAQVNPVGGAVALGHALGSSGSRILVTLLHQLKVGQFGVAAICNGGGGATAMIVERISSV